MLVVDSITNGGSDTTKGSTSILDGFTDAQVIVKRESTLVTSNPLIKFSDLVDIPTGPAYI